VIDGNALINGGATMSNLGVAGNVVSASQTISGLTAAGLQITGAHSTAGIDDTSGMTTYANALRMADGQIIKCSSYDQTVFSGKWMVRNSSAPPVLSVDASGNLTVPGTITSAAAAADTTYKPTVTCGAGSGTVSGTGRYQKAAEWMCNWT
jgi:hypothetical protein